MFNRKDYPAFSYFMDMVPVMADCIDDPDYKLWKTNDIYTEFARVRQRRTGRRICQKTEGRHIKDKSEKHRQCKYADHSRPAV